MYISCFDSLSSQFITAKDHEIDREKFNIKIYNSIKYCDEKIRCFVFWKLIFLPEKRGFLVISGPHGCTLTSVWQTQGIFEKQLNYFYEHAAARSNEMTDIASHTSGPLLGQYKAKHTCTGVF